MSKKKQLKTIIPQLEKSFQKIMFETPVKEHMA